MSKKITYTKEILLTSKRFADRKDALSVAVKDGEELTIGEAEKRLDEFMKGEVSC